MTIVTDISCKLEVSLLSIDYNEETQLVKLVSDAIESPPRKDSSDLSNNITPKPRPEIEVGYAYNLPFVTAYDNRWEILRSDDVSTKQLVSMRKTDGQAQALYRLMTLPIRAALKTSTFIPMAGVEGGEEEADFIRQLFTLPASAGGMVVPFNKVMAQFLRGVFDGFSAFEMVYWVPKTGPLKNKWTLKKISYRPAETVTFLVDNYGDYAGLRQQLVWNGRAVDVIIPPDNSFYWAAQEEESPFYGRSFFHAAFYHWDKKARLYWIAHVAAQRSAVGTRVGYVPEGSSPQDKADFARALSDLSTAQHIRVPEKFKVDSLKEGGNFDFLGFINHHNNQMSKSVLAPFFDDSQGGGRDNALVNFGQQSDALFLMMLQTIMDDIAAVINNEIIPRFIDWNFGSGKYPMFRWGEFTDQQKSVLVETFNNLSTAGQGLTVTEEMVFELEKKMSDLLNLEVDYDTIEAEREQQKELEKTQQELAMLVPAVEQAPATAQSTPQAEGAPTGPAVTIPPEAMPTGAVL